MEDYFYMSREGLKWCLEAKTAAESKARFLEMADYGLNGIYPKMRIPQHIMAELEEGILQAEKEKRGLQRKTKEYNAWRTSVFMRDNFTCQICGQVGGTLNAHHIKPYAKYPDDRLDVDNGVTLCKACHKNVHRKKT